MWENNNRAGEGRKCKTCEIAKHLFTGMPSGSFPKWSTMKRRDSMVPSRTDIGIECRKQNAVRHHHPQRG